MALGSEVNNDKTNKNGSKKVKKDQLDCTIPSSSDSKKGAMATVNAAASNGHDTADVKSRADDEGGGGGGGVKPPSYAAAAAATRRSLPPNAATVKPIDAQPLQKKETQSPAAAKSPGVCPHAKVNGAQHIVNGDTLNKSKENVAANKVTNGSDDTSQSDKKSDTNCDISSSIGNVLVNGTNSETVESNKTFLNGDAKVDDVKDETNDKCEDKDKSDTDESKDKKDPDTDESKDKKEPDADESKDKKEPDADESKDKKEPEVVFIQDMGFTVKIVSPGADSLDIQVSSMELVQEIHQVLMDREDTCHRTCFSLQLDGATLDNFAELKNIEGLKEGSVIKVVEEPYTMREARIHVRHVRDLLKSVDYNDAYAGLECSSLSFLNIVTNGDILEKKKTRAESVDCTPPDHIMPGSKERPLLSLHPGLNKENKTPQCLKVLTTSGWNPPPGPRKMHGDLLYLKVVTTEDRHLHITACPQGFYVNLSTDETFDPRPSQPTHLCHSLIELLSILSPGFKRSFAAVQKKRTQKHPFERVATPYQVYQWASPALPNTVDAIRAEDTFSSKLGYEEHIPGQTRDWNEELQTTRELPRTTLPERLLRERAIFKVHSDFVAAATRGAVAVVDGNVMAINPGEEAKMQMFIWNNIFFSLGFDVRDHYKELGGDAAAHVAPRNDLQGVRVYSAVDTPGLHTLGTVVVDYRGMRVTAQSIIPGILEKEQEQSVVYGSIDFGATVLTHPKYMELLSKAGQQLKILPHSVISAKGETVELCSSVECKGIIGNDARHYILDLLRTFPPDVNFLKLDEDELREDIKAMGFPILHKHKLCCLRQELVDSFVEARYFMFIRYAAYHLQQLGIKKQKEVNESKTTDNTKDDKTKAIEAAKNDEQVKSDTKSDIKKEQIDSSIVDSDVKIPAEAESELDTDEAKKIVESITDSIGSGDKQEMAESMRSVVRAAARTVGSLKDSEFDIRFNPDVYSAGIRHAGTSDQLAQQRRLVRDAAAFLVTTQIPAFVSECLEHTSAPLDGWMLTEALHSRGINARYLGHVARALKPHPGLKYLHALTVAELLLRAAKHVFTTYLQQSTPPMQLGAAIAHFLCCLLGAYAAPEQCAIGASTRRTRRRRHQPPTPKPDPDWHTLTHAKLFGMLKNEAKAYWGYEFGTENMESTIEKYKLQKISLLRSFALKVGLQILLREYDFENKHKPVITSADIMNVFPVVKHINPRASDAYNFYTTGQAKIQSGQVQDGQELIAEALNLLNNVYGALHPEIAQCLRMLARLCYVAGEHRDAMAYQQKAVLMSERVNGIDHPYTITEYTHLALYCFANGQVSSALKLLYRARYLAILLAGELHPEVALIDSNISLILHAVGEYELSLRFVERALATHSSTHGARSLKAALARHLLARTLSCLGDFRAALQHEKETYSIYKQLLGEKHEKTRESSECLRHLTAQAVVVQKRLHEAYAKSTAPPPLHIQPPAMGSVLDMLNVINGILFVQISPQDIEHLKAEMEKRHIKDLTLGEEGDEKSILRELEQDSKSDSAQNERKLTIDNTKTTTVAS